VPENHHEFVINAARRFFAQKRLPGSPANRFTYNLAILVNPAEALPPSNRLALRRFVAAGRRLGMNVELIERDEYRRVAEFDALFIRETTRVDHHTYRFARRAASEGLVVIDDPESIVRCTNKVFLTELFAARGIPMPQTMIIHRRNRDRVIDSLALPCVLKLPDGSFSQGVEKAESAEALQETLDRMFEHSDLVIGQRFVPTAFDWRIGMLDRAPLYACRYHMVDQHWQIYKFDTKGTRDGDADAVSIDDVPPVVLNAAQRAAKLIGDGFYGVDVKQLGRRAVVIEINDNPTIDAGVEDGVMGRALYDRIMTVFRDRLEARTLRKNANGTI
jgi:glutathione synthase/RimK-type ligase-like ATP-grasp enzyme